MFDYEVKVLSLGKVYTIHVGANNIEQAIVNAKGSIYYRTILAAAMARNVEPAIISVRLTNQ